VVSIVEIDLAFAIGNFDELSDDLLPNAPALILQQSPMASLPGSCDVVRQVIPAATSGKDL